MLFSAILLTLFLIETDNTLKEKYQDCEEVLNNTTLQECCNRENNSPDCIHFGWCTTLKIIKESAT